MQKNDKVQELEQKLQQAIKKESGWLAKAADANRELNSSKAEKEFIMYQLACAKAGKPVPEKPDPYDQRETYTEADEVFDPEYDEFAYFSEPSIKHQP